MKIIITTVSLIIATNSFAYYNSEQGRWLSRDPLGENEFYSKHIKSKNPKQQQKLYAESLLPPYLFLSNDPLNYYDVLGLNRYITQFDMFNLGDSGGTQLHVGVAVDKWKCSDGKWVKDGIATFDFSIDWEKEDGSGDFDWWNYAKGVVWKGRGTIVESAGLNLEAPQTLQSSPLQDIKMLELLREEMGSPPFYNALTHQCIFWSVGAVQYGMDEKDTTECCSDNAK